MIISLTLVLVALTVPTLTARAQQQEWKFEDDFSSRRGGWPTGTTPRGDEYGYADGKYRVLIKVLEGQVAAGQIAGIPLAGKRFQVLRVDTDAVQQTGPAAVLQGIGCGTSATELYLFFISLDGSYVIMRDDAETGRADLLQTGTTGVIIRGIGATNRIRAQCIGGEQEARLILSVNGEKVAEARGETGERFDRTAFFVTTLHAVANSTHAVGLGVSKESPGSSIGFTAEVLFDNFALAGRQ